MCFHDYKYIGRIKTNQWLYGVTGGIATQITIDAKQCKKCGKIKEVE
jgi:hypothetical protein